MSEESEALRVSLRGAEADVGEGFRPECDFWPRRLPGLFVAAAEGASNADWERMGVTRGGGEGDILCARSSARWEDSGGFPG